jgi:hypothetical protein
MNFEQLFQKMRELDQPVSEAEKKADKDYDGDGKVESGKDEYMGSRMKAAEEDEDDKETSESLDQLVDEVETEMDECGMGSMNSMSSPMKQTDNVSMNLSMNGSGSGGIRDLMNILRNLDGDDSGMDSMGDMGDSDMDSEPVLIAKKTPIIDDDYANSPDEVTDMSAQFPSDHGNDLHKEKNSFSDKPYRGDNPMAVEGLRQQLGELYQQLVQEEASRK